MLDADDAWSIVLAAASLSISPPPSTSVAACAGSAHAKPRVPHSVPTHELAEMGFRQNALPASVRADYGRLLESEDSL